MKKFLREMCELWYWALFCPTKLQRRINASVPAPERRGRQWKPTGVNLLFAQSKHLLSQFVLLAALPLLPLSLAIANNKNGQPVDWLFVPAAILGAYGLGVFFRSLGLYFPLLILLLYLIGSDQLHAGIVNTLKLFPASNVIGRSINTNMYGLLISGIGFLWLLRRGLHALGRAVLIGGIALSIAYSSSIGVEIRVLNVLIGAVVVVLIIVSLLISRSDNTTEDTVSILTFGFSFCLVGGGASLLLSKIVDHFGIHGTSSLNPNSIPLGIAISIAIGIALGIAVGTADIVADAVPGHFRRNVAIGVTGGFALGLGIGVMIGVVGAIIGLARLNLPLFLLAGWFIGIALAPTQGRWYGLLAGAVLVALGLEQHRELSLLVLPAVLLGYYRLLPEYVLFAVVSRVQTALLERGRKVDPLGTLGVLPPHTSELLWLPLPGHHAILAAAFRDDPALALETLQRMRTTRLPGFRRTIRRALPQIVAGQLLATDSPAGLAATASPQHPFLPLLAPALYQPIEPSNRQVLSPVATAPGRDGSAIVWSQPRRIAHAIGAALNAGISFVLLSGQDDLATMLPHLQAVARDIDGALKAGSPFLRERSLEECLTRLARLQGQLPDLELEAETIPRWRTVLEHWQAILQTSLDQQRHLARCEIINPFQSGNPLRDDRPHLFKGRQSFADAIVRQVLERGRPTLVLYGPRRCGKSSFLLNLQRLLPGAILPVYLDLQNPAVTAGTADFCYSLIRAIARGLEPLGLQVKNLQRSAFAASPFTTLEDWLELVLTPLEGRRILLCLDEFEKLSNAIGQGTLDPALFDALRHLFQHRDELSFLLCGVQTLDELGPNWSNYFIGARPIEMTYLEEDEARAVLENPDPCFNLRYAGGVVERALKVTNRQPYLLQLVGEQMVKQANRYQTHTITQPLLAHALEAALAAGEPYFSNVWSEFTGTTAEEVRAGQVLLRALACGQPLVLDDALTQAVLRRLVRYHVLVRTEDGYCFEIPLIARWIRERAILI